MPELVLEPHLLREIQRILKQRVPHVDVLAYGSRVQGDCHPGSDLDLVLRDPTGQPVSLELLTGLRRDFEASHVPILVDVRDWSRLPPSFRTEIENACVLLSPGRE